MNVLGIIPARFKSSRFPGKPLVDIGGMTMIERVYRQCQRAKSLDAVIVATDDSRVFEAVENFGGRVKMTRNDHISGTDRVAEVAADFNADSTIINIQGDEPLIDPKQIDQLIELMVSKQAGIGSLARWITNEAEINNPNVVKVVVDHLDRALYFSRNVIPFQRSDQPKKYRQHIGIYGFKNDVLQRLTQLSPSGLETAESLEQLRWLENGFEIYMGMSDFQNIGVDSPEDVEQILAILAES